MESYAMEDLSTLLGKLPTKSAINHFLLINELAYRNLEILAERDEPDLHAIVFKIDSLPPGNQRLHAIAFFNKDEQQNYAFSHWYNLSELAMQYCTVNQAVLHIRQLGDAVLHQEAAEVTDFSKKNLASINSQLEIMKEVLYVTGGVGIAANQCLNIAKPFKIVLAGVDYTNPEHTVKAITRYPTALFPQLKVYLNPVITEFSSELGIFPEGCLSMQGALRALVSRPNAITLRYQDFAGKSFTEKFTGTAARVMLHEVDHITNGKVYIQRVISELTNPQLKTLAAIASEMKTKSVEAPAPPAFTTPQLVFARDQSGMLMFEEAQILEAFSKMPAATLQALHLNITQAMA
jgi:peptide deformylase